MIPIWRSNTVSRAYKTVYYVSSYLICCNNLQTSRFQPPFCNHWVLWEMPCQLRSLCVTSTSASMGSAMLPEHSAASHFPLRSQVKQCPHHCGETHKGPVAWSSPQRVGSQETQPLATPRLTSSGAWALGLLRLHRRLVHLARNLARVLSLLWFVRNMMHYPGSLSCCLYPVIIASQRALTGVPQPTGCHISLEINPVSSETITAALFLNPKSALFHWYNVLETPLCEGRIFTLHKFWQRKIFSVWWGLQEHPVQNLTLSS